MDITGFAYVIGIIGWILITFFYGIFELITNDGKLRDGYHYGTFKGWVITSLGGFILFVIMKYFNLEMPEEEDLFLSALIVILIILLGGVWTGKIKLK